MRISSGAVGAWPATMRIGLSWGLGFQANASGGAWPLVLSPLPCLSTMMPKPDTLATASLTPGTRRTRSTRLASIRLRCWLPCVSLNWDTPRTWAARPALTFTTRLLNVRVIVSDSTSVPAMKATPSTMATDVSRIRHFLAAIALRVTFHMSGSPSGSGSHRRRRPPR